MRLGWGICVKTVRSFARAAGASKTRSVRPADHTSTVFHKTCFDNPALPAALFCLGFESFTIKNRKNPLAKRKKGLTHTCGNPFSYAFETCVLVVTIVGIFRLPFRYFAEIMMLRTRGTQRGRCIIE